MKTPKYFFTIPFLIICICLGAYLPNQFLGKPTLEVQSIYPAHTIDSLTKIADRIIVGEVVERGPTKKVKIPVSTEIDVDDRNKGQFVEDIVTEVKIKVTDPLKNSKKDEIISYYEEGGETEQAIFIPEGGRINKREEVLIFINEHGYSWGPQSVIKSLNDKYQVEFHNDKGSYDKSVLKNRIKEILEKKQ